VAKLSERKRESLSTSQFGLPDVRKYPCPTGRMRATRRRGPPSNARRATSARPMRSASTTRQIRSLTNRPASPGTEAADLTISAKEILWISPWHALRDRCRWTCRTT